MNWRATHVLTAKRDLAIVPNSTIAKSKIVNASYPSGIHGMTVTVQLDAKTPPAAGTKILENAVLNARIVLATPVPSITVKSITANATEFEIAFFIQELAQSSRAQNEVFDLIYRHLAAAGIDLASNQMPPYPVPAAVAERNKALHNGAGSAARVLDLAAIFAGLTADERQSLAAKAKQKTYDPGEILVEPGTLLQSLFLIGSGVLSLRRVLSGAETEVMRLGPGDHFGEMGLLTGTASPSRICALAPSTVYELAKDDLAPVLKARPAVAQEMCRALARRQAAGQLAASPEIDASLSPNRVVIWFSDQLHKLLNPAGAS